jgi:hypothetical protein
MMAVAAEDGGGGQQQRWTTTRVMADNDSGRRRRRQTTTACKIGQRTTRGKEESGWQTTLDNRLMSPLGRKREKIKKPSLRKKTFFSNTVCPLGFFAPAKTAKVPF